MQNANRANELKGLLDDEGRNSRRGRNPLSAGDAGIGSPNEGFIGLALRACISRRLGLVGRLDLFAEE